MAHKAVPVCEQFIPGLQKDKYRMESNSVETFKVILTKIILCMLNLIKNET